MRQAAAIFLLLVVATAGCSSGARPAGSSSNTGLSSASAQQPPPEPLGDVLDFSSSQNTALQHAEQALLQKCMEAKGMPFSISSAFSDGESSSNPYSLITEAERAVGHYSQPAQSTTPPDPNAARLKRMTPAQQAAWRAALIGTASYRHKIDLPDGTYYAYNSDSCEVQARETLYGKDWDAAFFKMTAVNNEIIAQTLQQPKVKAALGQWSNCVRNRTAITATTPGALRDAELTSGKVTDPRAISIFTVDRTCEALSHLSTTIRSTQTEVSAKASAAYGAQLRILTSDRRAALKRASGMAPPTE